MSIGNIIGLIVVGAIVGAIARLVIPGRNPIGALATVLVGIVGEIVGGFIALSIGAGVVVYYILGIAIAALGVWLLTRSRATPRTRV